MLPGPDQVIACPNCRTLARYRTILSGNTVGARTWTDGKQVAPMEPHPPAVVRCAQCQEVYWLADAREIGEIDAWDGESTAVSAWLAAPHVEEPVEVEYYRAIERGLHGTTEEERTLRVLAWWRSNDADRDDIEMFEQEPPEAQPRSPEVDARRRANLHAILRLVDEDDDAERLMKVEVLRELGEFEIASAMLDEITAPNLAKIVREFRVLCDARDIRVRELQLGLEN